MEYTKEELGEAARQIDFLRSDRAVRLAAKRTLTQLRTESQEAVGKLR